MEKLLPIGKQKNIYVNDVHTFGTDAVLLANFSNPKPNDIILDIGSGCGIIPFLMLRDNENLNITAAEIQKDAALLCKKTSETQNMPLKVLNIDIKNHKNFLINNSFSLITCNPPYKTQNGGLISPCKDRSLQRHEITLNINDLAVCAQKLLKFGGRICICIRTERLFAAAKAFSLNGLEPKTLKLVFKNEQSEAKLALLECKKGAKEGIKIKPPLFLTLNGKPTKEIDEIYNSMKTK